MSTSSLKGKMVQGYREQLKSSLSSICRNDIPENALDYLDRIVAVVGEERNFLAVYDGLTMELSWLNSTASLTGHLVDFCMLPCTREVACKNVKEMPEEFDEVYKRITQIIVKRTMVTDVLRRLDYVKKVPIEDACWCIFPNGDDEGYDRLRLKELMTDRFSPKQAKIPGTDIEALVRKRQELCELFPELRSANLERTFVGLRLNFLTEKSPSEMDDFTSKIIQVVSEVLSDSLSEDLKNEVREEVMTALMMARKESFSGTTDN